MSEFVEECRREWRRLGVPDPVANEMAADIEADLDEAEAEGGSPEDVLGNSAFDPRRFAGAWAVARGVTGPPTTDRPFLRRPVVAIALTGLVGLLTLGAGLALLVGSSSRSIAFAAHRVAAAPGPTRFFIPGPEGIGPSRTFFGLPLVGPEIGGVDVHPLAWLLLIVGLVGLGLIAVLYWSPWSGPRGYRPLHQQTRPQPELTNGPPGVSGHSSPSILRPRPVASAPRQRPDGGRRHLRRAHTARAKHHPTSDPSWSKRPRRCRRPHHGPRLISAVAGHRQAPSDSAD